MIAGALGVAQGILVTILSGMVSTSFGLSLGIFACYGPIAIVLGIISVVGGISAVRQERFILAIIGSVCAIICIGFSIGVVLGIISLVFIAVSKDDFLS